MVKLILVDIDGTLVNDDKKILNRTKKALIECQERGIKVVIASGRSPNGISNYAQELDLAKYKNYISAQNGSILIKQDNQKQVANHTLNYDKSKELLQYIKESGLSTMIYYGGKVFTDDKNKFLVESTSADNRSEIAERKDFFDNLDFIPNNIVMMGKDGLLEEWMPGIEDKFGKYFDFVLTSKTYFEAMPPGISKATSLKDLCDLYDIPIEDTLAFGDSDNDYEMIKEAGIGVAMKNATKKILQVADYVTSSNNDDGIAEYLEKYVLI